MDPINYIRDVADPMQMTMQGYAAGTAMREGREASATQKEQFAASGARADRAFGLQESRFGLDVEKFELEKQMFAAQQSALQDARAKAEAMQADLASLSQKIEVGDVDVNDFAALAVRNPDLAGSMKSTFELMNGEQQKTSLLSMAQIYSAITTGNPEIAKGMLEDRLEAAENSGNEEEAATSKAALGLIDLNPNAAASVLGVSLKVLGGDTFDTLLGSDRALKSEILPGGVLVQATENGLRVTGPTGEELTGQAAADAIAQAESRGVELSRETYGARREGTLGADIEYGGEAAAVVKSGEIAQAEGQKAFEQVGKIRTNIVNINNAIAAIDAGADTGVVYKRLPNITKASASLQNALDRMGLDVVSATTFGALSEGELRLAMETAAPRDLGPVELRAWLQEKADAQGKVSDMLLDAASFLSTPGNTLKDWVDQNNQKTETPDDVQGGSADADALGFLNAMRDKLAAGGTMTPEEVAKLKAISEGGGN